MGNIESYFIMQFIEDIYFNNKIYNKNNNKNNKKNNNDMIYYCNICNKNLINDIIYRSNDLSFCSEQHRNINIKNTIL